jgi:hypothetical protein
MTEELTEEGEVAALFKTGTVTREVVIGEG